jgi:hypothetical protein
MTEKRADELVKGDVLDLKGDPYTVVKVKTTSKGKHVRLTIDGRRGSFTDEVKARTVYAVREGDGGSRHGARAAATDVVEDSRAARRKPGSGPSPSPRFIEGVPVEDLEVPFDRRDAEANVVSILGARLVGVEEEGGRLVVPPVTDATILGHLLTFHGRRFDGATVADAKAWAKANPGVPGTMQQTLDTLSFVKAHELHDALHKDLLGMPRPHWHEEATA